MQTDVADTILQYTQNKTSSYLRLGKSVEDLQYAFESSLRMQDKTRDDKTHDDKTDDHTSLSTKEQTKTDEDIIVERLNDYQIQNKHRQDLKSQGITTSNAVNGVEVADYHSSNIGAAGESAETSAGTSAGTGFVADLHDDPYSNAPEADPLPTYDLYTASLDRRY
mmetsp:Transcript_23832/g.42219  ORF Transcript_23832/g.42219 Transcript_23832/m.42219 type:complete len:166 (+) Transcript_23832:2302-2799(+)